MKKMYFGTREKMQWVKCPATNISRNRAKWQETGAYLNGGAFSAASAYSHMEYNIAWNLMASEEAAKIMSYFEGMHGDGLIYFLEPFAKKSNVLPLHWSVPRLCAKDAPNLLPAGSARPIEVPARVAVATNLATNPSFEATSGTVEVRRNLAHDPRATVLGGIPSGQARWLPSWFGSGGAGTTTLVTGATDGPEVAPGVRVPTYMRKTWTVAGSIGDTGFDHTTSGPTSTPASTLGLPVVAGRTYTFSSWVRASRRPGTANVDLRVVWRDAAGERILPAPTRVLSAITPGVWQRVSITLTAPANAATASISTDIEGGGATWQPGDTLDGTALLIEESPVLGAYFDGSTSPDSDLTPSWTGTANASASVLTGVGVNVTPSDTNALAISSSRWAKSGSKSLRLIPRNASTDSQIKVAGGYSGLTGNGITFVGGKTYTVLVTVRVAEPQAAPTALSRRIQVNYNTVAGYTGFTQVLSGQAPNLAGDYTVRATFTLPADVLWCAVRLHTGVSVGNGDVWWDNLAVFEGTYTGSWFDGSNAPESGTYTAWTGAANASTSTLTSDIGGGRPATSAQFSVAGTDGTNPTIYVPVPPGENFYMEVCGVAGGSAGVRVIPDRGSAVTLAPTALGTPATATLNNPGGVTLRFAGTGTFTLNSMRATVGTSAPDYSVFRQGEGNSGVRFNGNPVRTGYSSALDLESVTAEFVEVGAWL